MYAVLAFAVSPHFLRSRHKALALAGLKIISVETRPEALHHLAGHPFELLLVGQGVPIQVRNEVALRAKERKMRVIFLYQGSIAQAEAADALLTADVSSEDLISTMFRLATSPMNEGSRLRQANG